MYPLRIHGTGTFTHMWLMFLMIVGKKYRSFHRPYGVISKGFVSFGTDQAAF